MDDSRVTPHAPQPAAPACTYTDVTSVDRDDPHIVTAALRHMATAAAYACGAVHRNAIYPADLAVGALADTVAAATIVADHTTRYLTDVWPDAAPLISRAHQHLNDARAALDEARHHCGLTASALEDDNELQDVLARNC